MVESTRRAIRDHGTQAVLRMLDICELVAYKTREKYADRMPHLPKYMEETAKEIAALRVALENEKHESKRSGDGNIEQGNLS